MPSLNLLSRFDRQRLLAMSTEDRLGMIIRLNGACLLYTSDAADE